MLESLVEEKVFVSRANSYLYTHLMVYLMEMKVNVVIGIDDSCFETDWAHLRELFEEYKRDIEVFHVDYSNEESVSRAIDGCSIIYHQIATDSWYPETNEIDCYRKPITDTLMLMHCASAARISRVIFTGSLVSVYGGISKGTIEVSDLDWGNPYNLTGPARGYLYTERALWAFNQQLSPPLNITVLNIGALFGPSLSALEKHSSVKFMVKLLNGRLNSLLPIRLPTLDVRDAALAHLLIRYKQTSFGKRFNVSQGCYWLTEIAEILNDEFKHLGIGFITSEIGGLPIKLASIADSKLGTIFFHCGKDVKISSYRVRDIIEMKLRSLDETIIDMGYHFIDRGLIKKEIDILKLTPSIASKSSKSDSK